MHYYKLEPAPPMPDVHLADLEPADVVGPGHSPDDKNHRFSPVSRPPQKNRSNRGQPLRIGKRSFDHGLGVHAPNRLLYRIDKKWGHFVALAGIDENIIDVSNASDLGCLSSVIFRVFLDGKLEAESPVMRFMNPPWRFNVPIPDGAKYIALVAYPTEDGNREDLANWVKAGFVLRNQ